VLFALKLFFLAAPAPAQDAVRVLPELPLENPAAAYRLCLDATRAYPDQGFELAGKWIGLGGGEPAKHCRAVALIGLKEYAEAGASLEDIASTSKQPARTRAGMLAQAGRAWLLGEDLSRALAALNAAVRLVPGDPALLTDRAEVLVDGGQYWEAIDDLNAVLDRAPRNADALTFRASAYRMVDAPDLAFDDAERALGINPRHLGALLERGILHRAASRTDDARRDWLRILELAPQSAEADAARANLEKMDVRPDR
jgi:tetratricopeptide (TPR) repeat protein